MGSPPSFHAKMSGWPANLRLTPDHRIAGIPSASTSVPIAARPFTGSPTVNRKWWPSPSAPSPIRRSRRLLKPSMPNTGIDGFRAPVRCSMRHKPAVAANRAPRQVPQWLQAIDETRPRSSIRHAGHKKWAAHDPLALDDVVEHFRIAHAAEAFDEILFRDRIAAGGQDVGVGLVDDRLAVDEHPVAVENDQLETAGNRSSRSAYTPMGGASRSI